MTTLKVTNLANEEWRDSFANQPYVIPPNHTAIIDSDAVKLWTGDYEALDRPNNPARLAEFMRLKVRYGCSDDPEMWERDKPVLAVEDIEGNKITTVIEDPTGETINPPPAQSTDLLVLEDALRKQQRQIEILTEELATRKATEIATQVELPADTPENAPTSRAKRDPAKAPRDE